MSTSCLAFAGFSLFSLSLTMLLLLSVRTYIMRSMVRRTERKGAGCCWFVLFFLLAAESLILFLYFSSSLLAVSEVHCLRAACLMKRAHHATL